jgi:hypothetical protein
MVSSGARYGPVVRSYNSVMKLRVPLNAGNFLIRLRTISFSRPLSVPRSYYISHGANYTTFTSVMKSNEKPQTPSLFETKFHTIFSVMMIITQISHTGQLCHNIINLKTVLRTSISLTIDEFCSFTNVVCNVLICAFRTEHITECAVSKHSFHCKYVSRTRRLN